MDAWVFLLSEARGLSRDLLGGKGFGLVEMAGAGLPVPPAFVVTTEACRRYLKAGEVPGLWEEVRAKMAALEGLVGKRFGRGREDPSPPCFRAERGPGFHARHDGHHPQPGPHPGGVEALARATGNPRFAWDSFRRLLAMYGEVVLGERAEVFEGMLSALKEGRGRGRTPSSGLRTWRGSPSSTSATSRARAPPSPQTLGPSSKGPWRPSSGAG